MTEQTTQLGKPHYPGVFRRMYDISDQFNGANTQFTIEAPGPNGKTVMLSGPNDIMVIYQNILLRPGIDYDVISGNQLVFLLSSLSGITNNAPITNAKCTGLIYNQTIIDSFDVNPENIEFDSISYDKRVTGHSYRICQMIEAPSGSVLDGFDWFNSGFTGAVTAHLTPGIENANTNNPSDNTLYWIDLNDGLPLPGRTGYINNLYIHYPENMPEDGNFQIILILHGAKWVNVVFDKEYKLKEWTGLGETRNVVIFNRFANGETQVRLIKDGSGLYTPAQAVRSGPGENWFGASMKFSPDSTLLFVGAPMDDTGSNERGRGYIYRRTWTHSVPVGYGGYTNELSLAGYVESPYTGPGKYFTGDLYQSTPGDAAFSADNQYLAVGSTRYISITGTGIYGRLDLFKSTNGGFTWVHDKEIRNTNSNRPWMFNNILVNDSFTRMIVTSGHEYATFNEMRFYTIDPTQTPMTTTLVHTIPGSTFLSHVSNFQINFRCMRGHFIEDGSGNATINIVHGYWKQNWSSPINQIGFIGTINWPATGTPSISVWNDFLIDNVAVNGDFLCCGLTKDCRKMIVGSNYHNWMQILERPSGAPFANRSSWVITGYFQGGGSDFQQHYPLMYSSANDRCWPWNCDISPDGKLIAGSAVGYTGYVDDRVVVMRQRDY